MMQVKSDGSASLSNVFFSLMKYKSKRVLPSFLILFSTLMAQTVLGQKDTSFPPQDSTLVKKIEAGESADDPPKRKLVKWNEFDGKFMTLRVGAGFLYDVATYIQDNESKQQVDAEGGGAVRDFRFLLKGRFKFKRPVTWTAGIMYDGVTKTWLFRETGIMVAFPELWGHIFIGRTKEGFSMNKVMVGYAGWTMERATMNDATVPILADGIKWLGYIPSHHLLWNLGYYFDKFNANQSFSSYKHQFVARVVWLPKISEAEKTVFHIGWNFRYAKVDDDTLQLRSRPESNIAPYFVDTKPFYCKSTLMSGGEIYYRRGSWLFGSEYWFQKANAPVDGDPFFHGGDVSASWLITGETRAYNTVGGFFKGISPKRTIWKGGPGALEAVLRFSYIDLDGGKIKGGEFWRLTPTVNWFPTDNIRLSVAYGYGKLYRFNLIGGTQFFQARIQLQI